MPLTASRPRDFLDIPPKIFYPVLLILFFISRFLFLTTQAERVSNLEELYRGAVAFEITQGLKFPILEYQADPYHGGSLVAAFATAPFFKFFGPSLFSLKLATLFYFHFPAFILLLVFLHLAFGWRSAAAGGFLFLLAPPNFIANALATMGFHPDSMLFSLVLLLLFWDWEERGSARTALAAGFFSGFGIWFTHSVGLVMLSCLASHLLIRKDSRKPFAAFLPFALGLFAGLSPWIFYNLTHHGDGVEFLARLFNPAPDHAEFSVRSILSFGKRFIDLLVRQIPASWGYLSVSWAPGYLFNYAYYLVAAYCALALWEHRKSEKQFHARILPLLLYPCLFTGIYSVAVGLPMPSFAAHTEFRFFAPFQLVLILLVAIAAGNGILNRRAFMGLLLLCFAGHCAVFAVPHGDSRDYRGYSYYRLSDPRQDLWNQIPQSQQESMTWFQKYPESVRPYFYWGLTQQFPFKNQPADPAQLAIYAKNLPEPYRRYWLEGLGFYLADQKTAPPDFQTFLNAFPEESQKYLWNGFAIHHPSAEEALPWARDFRKNVSPEPRHVLAFYAAQMDYQPLNRNWFYPSRKLRLAAEDEAHRIYQGIGAGFSGFWIWDPGHFIDEFKKLLRRIPEPYREDFYWGIGWGIRREINEDRRRAMDWVLRFPKAAQTEAFKGLEAFDSFYGAAQ